VNALKLHQTAAPAELDLHRTVQALSADVQAALALTRAALQAIAAVSPASRDAAEEALDTEADNLRRAGGPLRVIATIEDARDRLCGSDDHSEMMGRLERALLAAADALPPAGELEHLEALRA